MDKKDSFLEKTDNPFAPKGVAKGNFFFNRNHEIKELESLIQSRQHVLVLAPRRIGKTSLINKCLQNLIDKDYRICFIDLFKTAHLTEFTEQTVAAILKLQKTPLDKLKGVITRGLPSIAPKLTFNISGEPELSLGISSMKVTLNTLSEVLLWNDKYKKNIIVFDEIQEILNWPESSFIEKSLRATIQNLENTTILFSGSAPSLLKKMFSHKSRAFYQLTFEFQLGFTPPHEAQKFLMYKLSDFISSDIEGLVTRILEVTKGHPYYVQLFGYLAWNEGKLKKSLQKIDFEKIKNKIFQLEHNTYEYALMSLTSQQRQVLKAIAQEPLTPPTSAGFLSRHRLPGHSSVRKAILKLDEKGFLFKEDNGYMLADPLLALWLIAK